MLNDDKKTKGDEAWNSNFWLKELAQISGDNALKSIFWETGEPTTLAPTTSTHDLTAVEDVKNERPQQQEQQQKLVDDKRESMADFTFDWGFPRPSPPPPAVATPAVNMNLLRASQQEESAWSTEESQSSSEDDDDESVEQITISLSTLVRQDILGKATYSHQVERIECTFEDLILGEESQTIQDVLARITGKEILSGDNSRVDGSTVSTAEISPPTKDDLEKVKRIENARLNAFAPPFMPVNTPPSSASVYTNEDANSCCSSSRSGPGEGKLNAFASTFVPSSATTVSSECYTKVKSSDGPHQQFSSISPPATTTTKLNPFSSSFVPPSQSASSSSTPVTTADCTAPVITEHEQDYSLSSFDSLFAPPKFFHSSSVTAATSIVPLPQKHLPLSPVSVSVSQDNDENTTNNNGIVSQQAHIALEHRGTVYFTTNAASDAALL